MSDVFEEPLLENFENSRMYRYELLFYKTFIHSIIMHRDSQTNTTIFVNQGTSVTANY